MYMERKHIESWPVTG